MAGKPLTSCPSLANYGPWSNWCRQPLLWLKQPDPAASVFKGLSDYPGKVLLARVLEGWHKLHGSKPKMVRDLVNSTVRLDPAEEDLREALVEAAGGNAPINVRKLGKWLARNEGRIAGPLRLMRGPKTRNAESWMVV